MWRCQWRAPGGVIERVVLQNSQVTSMVPASVTRSASSSADILSSTAVTLSGCTGSGRRQAAPARHAGEAR